MNADALRLREEIKSRYASFLKGGCTLDDVKYSARCYQAVIRDFYKARGIRKSPPSVATLIRQLT